MFPVHPGGTLRDELEARELTLKALAAGKHVLVEKPAFLEVSEFDLVEAAAKRAGKQVLVAENYFYKPLRRTFSRIIGEGLLGQIRLIEINAVKQQKFDGPRDLKILYSPLHGVGASAVMPALAADNFTDVSIFGPHKEPSGDFPNVPGHVSNPENPAVFL